MQQNQTIILSAYDLSHNLPNLVKFIKKQTKTDTISTLYNKVAIIFGYPSYIELVNYHKKNETTLSLNETIDKTKIYAEISQLISNKHALCLKLLNQFDCFKIHDGKIGNNITQLTENVFFYQKNAEMYLSCYEFEQHSKIDLTTLVNDIAYHISVNLKKNIPFSLNIFRLPTAININFDSLKKKEYSTLSDVDKVMMLYAYDLNNICKKQAYCFHLVVSSKNIDVINLINQFIAKEYLSLIKPLSVNKVIETFNLCETKKCDYSQSQMLLKKQTDTYPYFNTATFDQDYVCADSVLFTHLNITYNNNISVQFGIESCCIPYLCAYIADTPPLNKIHDNLSTTIISKLYPNKQLYNQQKLIHCYSEYLSIALNASITPIIASEKYTHYLHTNGFPMHSHYLCGNVADNKSQQDITMLLYRSGSGMTTPFHYAIINQLNQGKKVIIVESWEGLKQMSAVFNGETVYSHIEENESHRKLINVDMFQYIHTEQSVYSEKEISILSLYLKEILLNYDDNELEINVILKKTKFNSVFHLLDTLSKLKIKESMKQWLSGPCVDMNNSFICFNLNTLCEEIEDIPTLTNVIAILAGYYSERHFVLLNDFDFDHQLDYSLHVNTSITYAIHWSFFESLPITVLSKVNRILPLKGKENDSDSICKNKSHLFSSVFTQFDRELRSVFISPISPYHSFSRLVILNKVDNEWHLIFAHFKKDRLLNVLKSLAPNLKNESAKILQKELNSIKDTLSLNKTNEILDKLSFT